LKCAPAFLAENLTSSRVSTYRPKFLARNKKGARVCNFLYRRAHHEGSTWLRGGGINGSGTGCANIGAQTCRGREDNLRSCDGLETK
jgi:hypothetical protein